MILQQLWADADAIMNQTGRGQLPPVMYMPKRVRWIIELSQDPRMPIQLTPTPGMDNKGVIRVVPSYKGTSNVSAILLTHKPSYTLGVQVGAKTKDAQRTTKEHQSYKDLILACAEATKNEDVKRVVEFLRLWNPDTPLFALPPELGPDDLMTFRVDDHFPMDDAHVQAFWATEATSRSAKSAKSVTADLQCLVSGLTGPVEETMPLPVKGIADRKGKIEDRQLVSINTDKTAFMSYGLMRAKNSPISRSAAERFGQALNALLASDSHHARSGNITYVFWARGGVIPLFVFSADRVDPADLKKLISAAWRGDTSWANNLPATDKFHIFGLSSSGTRVVVRSAIDTTIEEVGRQQAVWFSRLEIIGTDGLPGRPLPLKTLAVAPYREFKDIAPGVEDALVQAALTGSHLPESLLTTLVMRCRQDTDNRVTYPRAALMKYILTQNLPLEEAHHMTQEATESMPTAYHCGRLFAELADIQKAAIPSINAGIGDKFFGSASSAPASVFGLLLSGAQDHLNKLRKTNDKAYRGAEKRLEEILAEVDDFPLTLTLRHQAMFSLGYYHHRAAKRRDIAERVAAKKQAGQITLDTDTHNEGDNA